jgi:myosin-5
LHLKLGQPDDFFYTKQGDAAIIDNINDSLVFKETLDAFNLLGIHSNEQDLIFNIVASIMHLGNVKLVELNSEQSACMVRKNDEALSIMCQLLQINEEHLKQWLCNKRIKTASEVVNVQLSLSQAYFARDALAKHMYSQMFNWIVSQINKCLKSSGKTHSSIGVLDIYGFETFEINSFEQFCINYANEKLQQQFCQHVFKLEQEEYLREQIKWSFIEFYDNQPCIDLIEGKLGILGLLDEECKV